MSYVVLPAPVKPHSGKGHRPTGRVRRTYYVRAAGLPSPAGILRRAWRVRHGAHVRTGAAAGVGILAWSIARTKPSLRYRRCCGGARIQFCARFSLRSSARFPKQRSSFIWWLLSCWARKWGRLWEIVFSWATIRWATMKGRSVFRYGSGPGLAGPACHMVHGAVCSPAKTITHPSTHRT